MLTLHIADKNESSWSLRPWILMHELGIKFTEQLHQFTSDGAVQSGQSFSPTGKVPCLVDGEIVVWDSLAITEYLAEEYVGVWPKDKEARAWARSAAAEMHSGFAELRQQCPMDCRKRTIIKEPSTALQRELMRISELWNEGFRRFGGSFLAGNQFTAVDAFFAPIAFRIQSYGLRLDDASMIYVGMILRRPAMQIWYEEALKEDG